MVKQYLDKQILIQVDKILDEKIRKLAEQNRLSISAFVRLLINNSMNNEKLNSNLDQLY